MMNSAIQNFIEKAKLDKEKTISIIGGGGKTSLAYALSDQFSKKETTILTTTTHMLFPEHLHKNQICLCEDALEIKQKLSSSNLLFLAKPFTNNKLTSVSTSFLENVLPQCDKMIIEADGSKHYPLKFEKDGEPAVPDFSDCVIQIAGASAFFKHASETLHRYEMAKEYFKWENDPRITASILSQLLIYNYNKVKTNRKIIVINQIDTLEDVSILFPLKELLPYEIYFISIKDNLLL